MTSGNDYVLQIKGNQPKLQAHIRACRVADPVPAESYHRHQERRSGRINT